MSQLPKLEADVQCQHDGVDGGWAHDVYKKHPTNEHCYLGECSMCPWCSKVICGTCQALGCCGFSPVPNYHPPTVFIKPGALLIKARVAKRT